MGQIKAELLPSFNNDLGVVNAAKVSFKNEAKVFDVGFHKGSHTRLVRYLAKHNHFTCFTHSRETFILQPELRINKLTEIDLAGMVFDDGGRKVRHSLWGWANLINKDLLFPDCSAAINDYMVEAYPNVWPELVNIAKWKVEFNDTAAVHVTEETDPRFIDATFRESVPIFIARQRFKHYIGFTYNEVSRRYVSDDPETFDICNFRARPDASIKQGSGDNLLPEINDYVSRHYDSVMYETVEKYKEFVNELNVAPELARAILPQSMMTQYVVTGSLASYKRLANQRRDSCGHAQLEIRDLAGQINEQLSKQYGELWDETIPAV